MHPRIKIIIPKPFPLDTTSDIPVQFHGTSKDDNKLDSEWDNTQQQQDFKREYLGIPFKD